MWGAYLVGVVAVEVFEGGVGCVRVLRHSVIKCSHFNCIGKYEKTTQLRRS